MSLINSRPCTTWGSISMKRVAASLESLDARPWSRIPTGRRLLAKRCMRLTDAGFITPACRMSRIPLRLSEMTLSRPGWPSGMARGNFVFMRRMFRRNSSAAEKTSAGSLGVAMAVAISTTSRALASRKSACLRSSLASSSAPVISSRISLPRSVARAAISSSKVLIFSNSARVAIS